MIKTNKVILVQHVQHNHLVVPSAAGEPGHLLQPLLPHHLNLGCINFVQFLLTHNQQSVCLLLELDDLDGVASREQVIHHACVVRTQVLLAKVISIPSSIHPPGLASSLRSSPTHQVPSQKLSTKHVSVLYWHPSNGHVTSPSPEHSFKL